jgi:superfamily II DNA or RNA helicase
MTETILCKNGYSIKKNNLTLINILKNELTVQPFQIIKFIKKKKVFTVYKEDTEHLYIPKFYGLNKLGLPTINNEYTGTIIDINFKGELRENQMDIINIIINHIINKDGGLLSLPCGYGKTIIALYLISIFKVKTLVVVHKTFLLNQWKERALEFTNAKLGIIQQNIVDVDNKDIVFAMLQSIAKDKYESNIFKDFGFVIFDEAHHAPSEFFSKALPMIACKKTLALSATPTRDDKLEKILYWYFGDLIYKLENSTNKNVLVNIINYKLTDHEKFIECYMKNGEINKAEMINNISTIGRRNKFIINNIVDVIKDNNRKLLVLSDRIMHLELLKNRLDKLNITTTGYYIGGMKQKNLKISEDAQVIFASYAMASEALDIPTLNTLFMVTPRSKIEQSIGRIIRKINIRPLVYDIVDQIPTFIKQSYNRKRFYKKMNFEIHNINIINNNIINNKIDVDNDNNIDIDDNIDNINFID